MPRIYICPLSQIYHSIDAHAPSHLMTLLDPHSMIETPVEIHPERHLRLSINDISEPREGMVAPDTGHIQEILAFIDSWDQTSPLLIHCWAGISRSTAAGFIALCHLNAADELQIALAMRECAPHAQPNRRLIALADSAMGRRGRMIEAVTQMGPGDFDVEGALFSLPVKISNG